MHGRSKLSPTALCCLDRQLWEALDLAVSCRLLADRARGDGDPMTTVALQGLSSDLADQVAILAPLARGELQVANPRLPEGSSSAVDTWLAELDHRLGQAALVAETDAMSHDLEATVVGLLSALAAHYHTRRELLLVSTMLDAA